MHWDARRAHVQRPDHRVSHLCALTKPIRMPGNRTENTMAFGGCTSVHRAPR